MKDKIIAFFKRLDMLQNETEAEKAHDYFIMQIGAQEVLKIMDIYVYIDIDGDYQVTDKETFLQSNIL